MYVDVQADFLGMQFKKFPGTLKADYNPIGSTIGVQQSGSHNQKRKVSKFDRLDTLKQ